jgi:WD40 repeat protein/nucleoside phosphorylase
VPASSEPAWLTPYLADFGELLRVVELSEGFILQPLEVPGPDLARALASFFAAHGHPAVVREPGNDAEWRETTGWLLEEGRVPPSGVVMVLGSREPPEGFRLALRFLNDRRDDIARRLGRPLFWCGPASFLLATAEGAPDFWSVRAVERRLKLASASREPGVSRHELLAEAIRQGDVRSVAALTLGPAREALAAGRLDEAAELLDDVPPSLADKDASLDAEVRLLRAEVHRRRGALDEAIAIVDRLRRERLEPRVTAQAELSWARLHEARHDSVEAERAYARATAAADSAGDRAFVLLASMRREALRFAGDPEGALRRLEDAKNLAEHQGDRLLDALGFALLSAAYARTRDLTEARRHARRAREIARGAGGSATVLVPGEVEEALQRAENEIAAAAPVDVLVLTALQDELEAVLALGEYGPGGWQKERDREGFRCYRRAFTSERGGTLSVVAAWTGNMGTRTAAIRAQQLVDELAPACLAMCGICAGYRKKVALGDVIIADQIYSYDEGKVVAEPGKAPEMFHSLRTFDLQATWKMDAAYLARELPTAALAQARPVSREAQERWLLHALQAHEAGGPPPAKHPDRVRRCPGWTDVVREAKRRGLVSMKGGSMALTDAGRERVEEEQVLHPDGLPEAPPFRIHVGAIACGSSVQEDPGLFERLRRVVRNTLGVEMEGAGIADVAARFEKRALLVKAVSDHADQDKDDSFRAFACRASAEVLLAFLRKHFEPERAPLPARRKLDDEMLDDDQPDRRAPYGRRGPEGGFLARVERVARLREPTAEVERHPAPPPFAGVLELSVSDGRLVKIQLVGALEQPVTEALLDQYVATIERPFRAQNPLLGSMLVHAGAAAPVELAKLAWRRGVTLTSFGEYQGLIDFTAYVAKQTQRLAADPIYPPSLYVEQPARWSLAGGREEQATESALRTLWELLEAEQARFALVLADFGAGKTFLLHELARRMAEDKHPLVPVLVEMHRLQKQQSLNALVAQQFALMDLDFKPKSFEYMLAEGRIALLFDGFDELALRLTYDRAVEHFETVTAAAQGKAKVVVTSRTQHFRSDAQALLALGKLAEKVPGYRLVRLEPFGEAQIRAFLRNKTGSEEAAEERYRLLDEVKDLLGLSANPRMLGFIADIDPQSLRDARNREHGGKITAAGLYEVLIRQWLDFEHRRANPPGAPKGVTREQLADLVNRMAGRLWEQNAKAVALAELSGVLVADELEPAVVEHMIGSGSLLVRDAEGLFSFVHRSVMEWLVANQVAKALKAAGDAAALATGDVSDLMADFVITMAGPDAVGQWAREKAPAGVEAAKKNGTILLRRLGAMGVTAVSAAVDFAGQDLRGKDLSGVRWQGANLARANIEGATLREADLRGASLVEAKLGRADLAAAKLAGADLTGADLRFARLTGADLTGARGLAAARMRGAKLVGAVGVDTEGLFEVGAAPPAPRQAEAQAMAASPSACNAVAWSPSGDLVATGHDDGSVRLWDVVSGQAIRVLDGHSARVWSVAFAPDGQTLASGSSDHTVRLWDVNTGRFLHAFEGHEDSVSSVAFAPDGQTLASGSYDTTVRLWDVNTGRSLRAFEGHKNSVLSVAFAPDGQTLASGSSDNTVRLWDVNTGRSLRAFEGHKSTVTSVAFAPDGNTLASGSSDNAVRLWNVNTGRFLRAFEGHKSMVLSVAFAPDGQTLASGSRDNTVRLWDVNTKRSLRGFEGHKSRVTSVAFAPDGQALVSGSSDNTVRILDVNTGRSLRTFEGQVSLVTSIALAPDGHTLALGSYDDTVHLWNVSTGRSLRTFEGHKNWVSSVAFAPDGQTLASGSYDETVRLWDINTRRSLRAFEGHRNSVLSVAFAPDGQTLASGSSDSTVRLWEVNTGRFLRAFEGHESWVLSVAFAPDGQALASGSNDTTVRLWDVNIGRSLRTFEGHAKSVVSIAFAPDGQTLASGSRDNTVRLWDVNTGRLLRAFEVHEKSVLSVAFAPDGQTLASGSEDATIRLWDVSTRRPQRAFKGHRRSVFGIAFSPDGHTLASASADGTIRLWSIATARCLAILLPLPEGWVAYTPDGRYKLGGDIAGSFWHVIGLCRFEPGELDPYLPHLRVPDDTPLYTLPPAQDAAAPPAK